MILLLLWPLVRQGQTWIPTPDTLSGNAIDGTLKTGSCLFFPKHKQPQWVTTETRLEEPDLDT